MRSNRSRFITFVQAATKSCANFAPASSLRVDLGQRPQLRVRAEDQVDAGCGPAQLAGSPVAPLEHTGIPRRGLPFGPHVQQVDEEVVRERSRAGREHAVLELLRRSRRARAARPRAPSSPAPSASAAAPVDQHFLRRAALRPGGSCGSRRPTGSSTAKDWTSVCVREASVRPGVNGTSTAWPAFGGLLDRGAAAEHDQVRERDPLARLLRGIELSLDGFERLQHLGRAAPAG